MAEVYGAVQDRILINLARHFPYIQEGAEPDGSFAYQSKMLAQMGQVNRETVQIIRDSLDGADDALKNSIAAAILDALKTVDPELEAAARQGLLQGGSSIPPPVTANMSQAFQSYYRQSADHLNLVNTVMLESTQQAYSATVADIANRISGIQRGLNVGTGEAVSGVSSYNQAIRHAVDRMVAEGITGFIDHGGRRWKAETYAAMDIKTTMFNTARAAIWERQEQYGNDLYQVSSHMGARPLCYPYQGKVISRTDSARIVTDLDGNQIQVIPQSQTSYGQAAGLFGINCKHYPMPFIPGFSTIKDRNRQDEEENAETYENLQTQRGLERKIREQKRDLAVLKAQKATDAEIKAARERVRKTSEEIDTFCEEKGLPRRRNREGTPINSTWPRPETYDAAIFDTDTRDRIKDFFEGGGIQNQAVTPNVPAFAPPVNLSNVPSTPQVFNMGLNPNVQDHIENSVGVKKQNQFSIGESRAWTNPNYDSGKWKYTNNCQRCVQAYELRRRGYDVEAMPRKRRNDTILWGTEIFNGFGKSYGESMRAYTFKQTEAEVKAELANAPNGARYSIYVRWEGRKSSHVFIAEKDNNVIKYIDPQSNKADASDHFQKGQEGEFGYFRMDDKPITDDETIIKETVRKGTNYVGK